MLPVECVQDGQFSKLKIIKKQIGLLGSYNLIVDHLKKYKKKKAHVTLFNFFLLRTIQMVSFITKFRVYQNKKLYLAVKLNF